MKKEEKGFYDYYVSSINYHGKRSLYDVYGRPSVYKERVWENIQSECYQLNGYDLTVVSRNTNIFTAGFDYDVLDAETGEILDIRHRHYLPSRTLDYSVLEEI